MEILMSDILIGVIVLGVVFGGALFGMFLRRVLPNQHLSTDARDRRNYRLPRTSVADLPTFGTEGTLSLPRFRSSRLIKLRNGLRSASPNREGGGSMEP
jgi:hypothetical protein